MKKEYYLILLFCIVAFTVYYINESIDFKVLDNITIEEIVILLVFSILPVVIFVFALRIFLQSMGYKPPFKTLYLITTSTMAINYATPTRVGIPLRAYLYKRVLGIPLSRGTASLAMEIFVQTLIPALISLFAIVTLFRGYGIWIPLFMIFLLFTAFYMVVFFKPAGLEKIASKTPFQGKMEKLLDFGANFRKGLRGMKKKVFIPFISLLLLMYVIGALRLYLILYILGFEINPLHLLYVNMMSFTVGMMSMVPMGLGTRDASLALLLMQLNISQEVAVSAAVLQRTLGTGLHLLLGSISASILSSESIKPEDS